MNDEMLNDSTARYTTPRMPQPPTPGPRDFMRFVVDHNPFFLLSGVSMLLGCFLINSAAHEKQDALNLIVGLLGVFNVYELLVIALGLFLVRSRGLVRDGAYLLLLEILLLSDLTFLYTEVFTANQYVGAIAASIGFGLAIAKLIAIFYVMRMRLNVHEWGALGVTFLTLFAMPGVLRHFGYYDMVTPLLLHTGWWAAGVLLAAMALYREPTQSGEPATYRLRYALRLGVAVVPWLSVVAHLASAHYVYKVGFLPANLAPLALGGAVLTLRMGYRLQHVNAVRFGTIALCLVGIALTLPTTSALYVDINGPIDWTLSPFRGATALSCVIGLMGMVMTGGLVMPIFSAASACSCVLGVDGRSLGRSVDELAMMIRMLFVEAAPTGAMGWGVLGVLGAFLFLGVGTALSLRHKPGGGDGGQSGGQADGTDASIPDGGPSRDNSGGGGHSGGSSGATETGGGGMLSEGIA